MSAMARLFISKFVVDLMEGFTAMTETIELRLRFHSSPLAIDSATIRRIMVMHEKKEKHQ